MTSLFTKDCNVVTFNKVTNILIAATVIREECITYATS